GLGGVARDQLFEPAVGGRRAAVQLLPVSGRAAGERGDREHDPAGNQPAAEGDEPLLGGRECGSGPATPGRRAFGSLGRERESYARGDGAGPANRLALGTIEMSGGVESAGSRG